MVTLKDIESEPDFPQAKNKILKNCTGVLLLSSNWNTNWFKSNINEIVKAKSLRSNKPFSFLCMVSKEVEQLPSGIYDEIILLKLNGSPLKGQYSRVSMATILITGCNRGIGLQLATQLKERGDTVIGVCRKPSDALRKLDIRMIDNIDVSDGESVSELAGQLAGETIDVLINNAGILRRDRFGDLDYDEMLQQFKVNTLGPLRVSEALADNLVEGSKVAIVTSRVGSIEDNGSGGNWGYRASKTAVNQVGMNLMHELRPRGIAVALLHPGLVATDMTGGTGIQPAESARGLIARIDELSLENSGCFWHAEGYILPW